MIVFFVHDNFIRPYIGDMLVVILIYCFLKSFLKFSVLNIAIFVLAFSFTIEFFQYINIIKVLNLEKSKIAQTVLGTSFSYIDLITYIIGIAIVIIIEKYWLKKEIN
ncbi:MAG: DUF2809 domain-containing protein [Patescibacteria group bacterium]|nr:DUF2809 domain-containing protein [Patescibacteria group bacterium]